MAELIAACVRRGLALKVSCCEKDALILETYWQ